MDSIFSQRLKTLREERGLTMQKLGEEIGTSGVSIGYYERGERVPDIHILAKMCQFFGVTSDYLIGLEDCRTHEAADISARTGLTEAAVEVLEFLRELDLTTIIPERLSASANYRACAAWCAAEKRDSVLNILSEIIESNITEKNFWEFVQDLPHSYRVARSSDGKACGLISVERTEDGGCSVVFARRQKPNGAFVAENYPADGAFLVAEHMPDALRMYEKYCGLLKRCRRNSPVLAELCEYFRAKSYDTQKLVINSDEGQTRLAGSMEAALAEEHELFGEFFGDMVRAGNNLVIPVMEILDEIQEKKIIKAVEDFKKKHQFALEAHKREIQKAEKELDRREEDANAGEE